MLLLSATLSVIAVMQSAVADSPSVVTAYGPVVGSYKTSQNGRKYAAYEGIPYAVPPEGELRFTEARPAPPWRGTLDATKKSSVCAQYSDVPPGKDGQPVLKGLYQGTEDCLYLNIYVPQVKGRKGGLPVIFFIHGGSFQYASGNMFGAKYLTDRDVIFVTFNYRLGILGFLSTEDEVLPGNLGLKDQNLALRWVNDNIGAFGGDSRHIVLSGFSAGSSSIQYHYLSPMSRGLFSGSIAMSGTAFNPWAMAHFARKNAIKLGAIFKCPTHDSRLMIECLKKVPTMELVLAENQFMDWQYNPEAPFAPVWGDSFMPLSPKETLESGKNYDAPALYGMVSQEGDDPVAEYAPHDNLLKQLDEDWLEITPALFEMQYNYVVPKNQWPEVAIAARKKYLGNATIDKKAVPGLIKMLTDQRYFIGFEDGIRLQAKASKSPVYLYYYAFRGSQSYSDSLSRTHNNYGVCHTDDMNLVVENPDIDPTKTQAEWEMSNFLMDIWVSVAYTGVPTNISAKWNPVDADDPELKYLHIAAPGKYSMSGDSDFGLKSFWKRWF
ncbi:venom carboxylesterase-6 [Nasonia vitripennis]|uniref:Carboxylic ester hydrolase n=1 Tax=Nasonia vitripennis TaxID=7425 RepID=A0A7M7GCZ0_NASVI|nr:venom carboxylesterase-6 [Nasonia vitripennis]